PTPDPAVKKERTSAPKSPRRIKVLHISKATSFGSLYPYGLTTLLKHLGETTSIPVETLPDVAESFEDEKIFNYPFIYINSGDRLKWEFSELEKRNIRNYLERGGFIHIDSGIQASFLRGTQHAAQHHSFADWEATPEVKEAFATVFPGRSFQPLERSHTIFRSFYKGLPDSAKLPDTVRDFVVNEKWPDGTYSFVGLTVNGRVAVLCTPIIAMGWGKNQLGRWQTKIGFRIRESAKDLGTRLEAASYDGDPFTTKREDGSKDIIYCQPTTRPAWVKEPNGRWRVFRYYHTTEISEFAHEFYTRLGTNIFIYALTH
ncbi:hypothetical protein BVX99_02005, partial [bacterium F16]